MKKYLLLLLTVVFLSSCDEDDDVKQVIEESPVSVLAYFVGENDLDDELKENIRGMFLGMSNMKRSATLLVYWDGISSIGGIETPVIIRYQCDGKGNINGKKAKKKEWELSEILDLAEIVKEYPDQLSTNKQVMSQVLSDMTSLAPTNRVGLVAGSHASSWVGATSWWSRAFGDERGNSIEISEMAEAMGSTNQIFDFLLFDACMMGSAEACYEFRDVTHYQIASVLEIPADGFPYDLMIENLFEGTVNGYKKACQAYIDYYDLRAEQNIRNSWGTISLYDSQKFQALAQHFQEQVVAHKESLRDFDVTVLQQYGKKSGYEYVSVDAKQFIKVLNDGNVPTDFEVALKEVVIYTDCLDKASSNALKYVVDKDNYCGLGVYVPVRGEYEWNNFFKTIDWYTAAGWNQISFDWYF